MSEPAIPLWKRVLFTVVLLALVLGIFEAGAHAYLRVARGYAGGEFLQYQFDPYKNIQLTPNWVDTRGVKHNTQGFRRSEDVSRSKPEGTFRIFLMGASTAYGLGGLFTHLQTEFEVLDNTETIDVYLEEILGKALPYKRVEVINAGIPSIWTHHHLIYLNQTILGYDPDLILFLDGWNDHFFRDRSHDQFASYAQQEQAGAIMGPPTLGSLVRMNGWWLFRTTASVHVATRAARDLRTIVNNWRGNTPAAIDVAQAVADAQWVFERNARRMIARNAALLRTEGIPAIFMLQPMLILERGRLGTMPAIERALFEFNVSWQGNFEEFMVKAAPLVSTRIEATVTAQGARYIDLNGLFANAQGQIFTDYAHLTPEGNRLVAMRVAAEIIDVVGPTALKAEP